MLCSGSFLARKGASCSAGPDGLLRPHPVVWRLVHGLGVAYLLGLTFLQFQPAAVSRSLLAEIDPTLGRPLPERTYGADCRILTPEHYHKLKNVREVVLDEFFLAHTLGWWGKAVVLRDPLLLWLVSVMFEVLELSLRHLLPNFNECWWDSWLVDVALTNLVGMWAGLKVRRPAPGCNCMRPPRAWSTSCRPASTSSPGPTTGRG